MQVPDYMHEHVLQAISAEFNAAANRGMWVVVLGLKPFLDGDRYCFLWGNNIQDGVAGFGRTALDAMHDFEKQMSVPIVVPAAKPAAVQDPEPCRVECCNEDCGWEGLSSETRSNPIMSAKTFCPRCGCEVEPSDLGEYPSNAGEVQT